MNNKTNAYPRLVGGTFITIVKQHMKNADSMGYICTQSNFVIQFFKAIGVDVSSYKKQLSAPQISHFSRCEAWPFKDTFLKRTNIDSLEASMSSIFPNIASFFKNYMDVDADMKVAAALKEMIETDESIKKTDKFLLDENGAFLTKEAITSASSLPYIPFIVGVALYSLKQDNKEGEATIREWCHHVDKVQPQTSIGSKYWGKISNRGLFENGEIFHSKESVQKNNLQGENNKEKADNDEIVIDIHLPPAPLYNADEDGHDDNPYAVSERDYQALWAQANNEERDQRDLNVLVKEINRKKNLYVKTSVYEETYNKVLETGCVLLTGNPGTGKSMTSELVALKFAGTGKYFVHYMKGLNEEEAKRLYDEISSVQAGKEFHFILIDDCMGQAFYQLGEEKEEWFHKLVAYVEMRHQRLKILLNSRINIVENSKKRRIYEEIFEELEKEGQIINANKLSNREKALILQSHIFYQSDEEHYKDIRGHKVVEIVKHNPYIPRVIYHVTRKSGKIKKPGDFYKEILYAFNNPDSIWDDIYTNDNVTPPEARVLLKALYSLTNTMVDVNLCFCVFNEFLELSGLKTDFKKALNIALTSLNSSMIKREIGTTEEMIGFVDPSVHDYLQKFVYYKKSEEYKSLFQSIVHEEQIQKLYGWDRHDYIDKLVKSGDIFKIKYSSENQKNLDIFGCIASSKYCLQPYKGIFNKVLDCMADNANKDPDFTHKISSYRYEYVGLEMILALMNDESLRNFYCGGKISSHVFDACTKQVDLYHVVDLLEAFYKTDKICFDFILDEEILRDLIYNACCCTIPDFNDYNSRVDIFDPNDISNYNDEINQEIVNELYKLIGRLLVPEIPETIYEIVKQEMDDFDLWWDFTDDIVDYISSNELDKSDEETLRESIHREYDDNSDWAIESIFYKPFPKKKK